MCWINVNSNDIAKLFKQGDTNIYIFLSMHNVLVLKNCVCFSNYLINDWRHFVPFIVNVFYFTKPTMSPSLKLHFFCVMRESFFVLVMFHSELYQGTHYLKVTQQAHLLQLFLHTTRQIYHRGQLLWHSHWTKNKYYY